MRTRSDVGNRVGPIPAAGQRPGGGPAASRAGPRTCCCWKPPAPRAATPRWPWPWPAGWPARSRASRSIGARSSVTDLDAAGPAAAPGPDRRPRPGRRRLPRAGCGRRIDIDFSIAEFLAHHAPQATEPRDRGWVLEPAEEPGWFCLARPPADPESVDRRCLRPRAGPLPPAHGRRSPRGGRPPRRGAGTGPPLPPAGRAPRAAPTPGRRPPWKRWPPASPATCRAMCPECGATVTVLVRRPMVLPARAARPGRVRLPGRGPPGPALSLVRDGDPVDAASPAGRLRRAGPPEVGSLGHAATVLLAADRGRRGQRPGCWLRRASLFRPPALADRGDDRPGEREAGRPARRAVDAMDPAEARAVERRGRPRHRLRPGPARRPHTGQGRASRRRGHSTRSIRTSASPRYGRRPRPGPVAAASPTRVRGRGRADGAGRGPVRNRGHPARRSLATSSDAGSARARSGATRRQPPAEPPGPRAHPADEDAGLIDLRPAAFAPADRPRAAPDAGTSPLMTAGRSRPSPAQPGHGPGRLPPPSRPSTGPPADIVDRPQGSAHAERHRSGWSRRRSHLDRNAGRRRDGLGVRIGSLEVRITPPAAGQAAASRRRGPGRRRRGRLRSRLPRRRSPVGFVPSASCRDKTSRGASP